MISNREKLSFIRDHYLDEVVGREIFPQVTSIPYAGNPLAVVSDYFLRKSTKTLDAMCVLCERGFAEDALVLMRTIFELAVHLKTIATPESMEERRDRAYSFIYDGDRQRVDKLNELAKLKQRGKCLSWISDIDSKSPVLETIPVPKNFIPLKSLKDLTIQLGGEWECWYYFLYWSVSKLTHPSGLGSDTYMQGADQDTEISRSIGLGLTMHYLLTDTVLRLLDLEMVCPRLEACMQNFLAHAQS